MRRFCLFLFVCLAFAGCSSETPEAKKDNKKQDNKKQDNIEDYPYPECAECVKWMKENAGEPDSLQIISWKKVTFRPGEPGVTPGTVRIDVKYRGKNQFGGWSVEERYFF